MTLSKAKVALQRKLVFGDQQQIDAIHWLDRHRRVLTVEDLVPMPSLWESREKTDECKAGCEGAG